MNKKAVNGFILLTIGILLFSFLAQPVRAQNYSFDTDAMVVDVEVKKDGSINIEYWINFTNHQWASTIDVVDIGFPNEHYDLDSVKAYMNGKERTDIRKSTYIDIGVEIWLGSESLYSGQSGQLHVIANNPKMIYEDWEDTDMASMKFSPTWFNSEFCSTYEYLEVNIIFPDGCNDGNEVKYHDTKYDDYSFRGDQLVYTWTKSNAPMEQYTYGVSFPKKYMDSYQPWSANPEIVRIIVNILITISLIGLIGGGSFLIYNYFKKYKTRYYPPKPKTPAGDFASFLCMSIFGVGFIFMMFWSFIGDIILIVAFYGMILAGFGIIAYLLYRVIEDKVAKLPYSEPNIKIDSIGVNQHLSVVEAAIIQNTPLNKVMFLIIFSLIRTGHLKIIDHDPLKFEVLEPKDAENLKIYQRKFLKAIKSRGKNKGRIKEDELKKLLTNLIKATYKKMKGYKLKETIEFYEAKIARAWKAVKDMPKELEWKDIEDQYKWLILDEDFKQKSKRVFRDRYYHHRPYYYNRYYYYHYYYPRYRTRYYPSRSSNSVPKQHINIHSFSDSIVRSIGDISNSIVTNFTNFADSIVSKVSPFKSTTGDGGRSGGGGGCACACACAGCACACAGGGR